jgi:hypothetical protein
MPQPYGTECCSGEVDVCRGGRVARFRDMMDGESDNGNGQRQVDEEDPSPGRDLHQPTTEKRAHCVRDARKTRPRADRPATILGSECGLQDRENCRE